MRLNVAVVCRGGPENGPFSAQAFSTIRKGLKQNGSDVAAIFAVSGSVPTALLGCVGEEDRLCKIWQNLTPEDIVGIKYLPPPKNRFDGALRKAGNIFRITNITTRMMLKGNAFSYTTLRNLLTRSCNLDKMFSPEAIPFKITAVDYFTAKRVVFSNRIPEHKECIIEGALGSMCLVPWFPSPTIPEAKRLKLLEEPHAEVDGVFLVDGAYRGGLLLEDAIRDPDEYDLIFVVDLHGLHIGAVDLKEYNDLPHRIQRISSIMTDTNDSVTMKLVDRINEEVIIEQMLKELKKDLPVGSAEKLEAVIKRMNEGRLRLRDKNEAKIVHIASPRKNLSFDFTKFTSVDILKLMHAGHMAALKSLHELGMDTRGLPLIDPSS